MDPGRQSNRAQIRRPWIVAIWEHDNARLSRISEVVERCGAAPLLLESMDAARVSESCSFALVALGGCPVEDTLALEGIRSLKRAGFAIVAHERGSGGWNVGARCRVLLNGAWCVLDSGGAGFSDELAVALSRMFTEAAEERSEGKRVQELMASFGIVGESEAIRDTIQQVVRIGPFSDLPVLITGESGTGKELLAGAIHRSDPKRRGGPFIAVNCGAISPGLAESELFGYKKGAFTGAHRDRKGLVRSAHGGTLFLDEIGELSLTLQAKLLRLLQENRVLGLGEDREVPVDFRVIGATNRRLHDMVESGDFRADLFHRLNLLSIHTRPLRERPEDVAPLIRHFLGKHQSVLAAPALSADEDFIRAVSQGRLPGNARQVEHFVLHALVNRKGSGPLGLSDLPVEVWREMLHHVDEPPRGRDSGRRAKADAISASSQPAGSLLSHLAAASEARGWDLAGTLDHCERLMVESALHRARGNHSEAARILGITPRSVYNKIRKHDLAPKPERP